MIVLAVKGARRADQLQDFLADAMHVHGERNAAVTHKGQPKLLFFHCQCLLSPSRSVLNFIAIIDGKSLWSINAVLPRLAQEFASHMTND
jgi:hypothetical protein